MSRTARDDQTLLASQNWARYKLGELPGVAGVTYGFVGADKADRKHVPAGMPLLQARDIADGAIAQTASMRIAKDVHEANRRAWLESGDLVIVLVGRVGDSALVGKEQAGWNAARAVGIVKFTAEGRDGGVGAWLRQWLKTPGAREWFNRYAPGSAHATLPVLALRKMPVLLPPPDYRRRLLHGVEVLEQRKRLNKRIAARAVELADAHFTQATMHRDAPCRPLAEVAKVIGADSRPKTTATHGASIGLAAPAEVLQSPAPYLDKTAHTTLAPEGKVCVPGSVLVAPRPGEVKAVMTRIPVVPGRGIAGLHTEKDPDSWWLLHELRSRSRGLKAIVQGTQEREISVKSLRSLEIFWPDAGVRRGFAQVASLLHDRAYTALKENRLLDEVILVDLIKRIPSHLRDNLVEELRPCRF